MDQIINSKSLLISALFILGMSAEMPLKGDFFLEESTVSDLRGAEVNNDLSLSHRSASDTLVSYAATKADISVLRESLVSQLRAGRISIDSVKSVFTTHLVDRIIPHWYGTPWSFGGHTAEPNQGKIACGYFISTTLRDMGLRLNRYRLAQKSPVDEASVISCGNTISQVVEESPDMALEKIDRLTKEGLHFIGFDTGHVGYLLKREGKLFLIHSNYLAPRSVCMEPLQDSEVFKRFTKFHLVDISHNEVLLQHWLNNTVIL